MVWYILSLILGFVMLVKGADFFVEGASGLAVRFRIPDLIIGLTIVAMGTSAPEAAVSIAAGFAGNADITIGNIVGSNILNTFVILGIASVIVTLHVEKSTVRIELPFMLLCSALLLVLGLDGRITLVDGLLLWAAFLVYLGYLFVNAKRHPKEGEETRQRALWLELLMIAGGLAVLVIGSKLAVSGASGLARTIGISERCIGLTIVALGTSLPELFTSVIAARKGNADIAVGNIVGSNIFNILFVVGTTSLLVAVPFDAKFLIDSGFMIASAVLLLLAVLPKQRLGRAAGAVMLVCYAVYFVYLCMT
ncbi:MAG: calcium/sodium antiporter [Oscillospiraceae bacterium]|nr:calcium/sodium antiporter [Oscillospiraceae bacterium]